MYRQLKNRKSARDCRKKRKNERLGMIEDIKQLKDDKNVLENTIVGLKSEIV